MVQKKHKDRPWRKIVRVDVTSEEKSSTRGRMYSWRAIFINTLTLECGHTQVRNGLHNYPKHKTICKKCEAGEKPKKVEVEPGHYDWTRGLPKDPVARAMIEAAARDARS